MPITYPTNKPQPSGHHTESEFVRCQDFVFRPSDVDGFAHQILHGAEPVTIVNFKGHAQPVTDPERRLFDLLAKHFNPTNFDETD